MTQEEKEKKKQAIITELYKSGEIQLKIRGMCHRNRIPFTTYIHEDILSETFYHLSRYNTDSLLEAYDDNPKRVLALAVRMAVNKGVAKCTSNPEYPKHSVMTNLLFASNLKSLDFLSPTEAFESGDIGPRSARKILVDETTEEGYADTMIDEWSIIEEHLSGEELELAAELMKPRKGTGRLTKAFTKRRNDLFERIKTIYKEYLSKKNNDKD